MKRKTKKAAIRKERHLTPAELKKISAGIYAAGRISNNLLMGERNWARGLDDPVNDPWVR